MNTRKFNEEVLFATDPIVRVGADDIEKLKHQARCNERKRIRLCAHKDHDDSIHEMLIVHEKGCYIKPHKHVDKTESFHIIEGVVDILLFDDRGNIADAIPMGAFATGRKFYYRLPPNMYHTLLITSELLVFHEITNGPFRPSETAWASWSPEEDDTEAVPRFMSMLAEYVEKHNGNG